MLTLLAAHGVEHSTADQLSKLTRSGKAAIYRRWSSVLELAAEAVGATTLVPQALDTGSIATDLVGLLDPWKRGLSRDEQAAAALISVAHHHHGARYALHHAVVAPLHDAVTAITSKHIARGEEVPLQARHSLQTVIVALWWTRYITQPPPQTASELTEWVSALLLPIARG